MARRVEWRGVERAVRLGLANLLLERRGRERRVEGLVGILGNVVGLGDKALEAIVVTVEAVLQLAWSGYRGC